MRARCCLRSVSALAWFLPVLGCAPAEWGARAIIQPIRRPATLRPDVPCSAFAFYSDGLRLEGWRFPARTQRRGTVVYLHGVADDRQSAVGVARRLGPLGYDVVAYDGRAHGRSEGKYCTYGTYEKRDLVRALDALGEKRVVLLGHSLGAAVALQAAAIEPRVGGVIAVSTFSDLPSIVADRAPWFVPREQVRAALRVAGRMARFNPSQASPIAAAPLIRVPVLVMHGADDRATRPVHSRRVFDRLTCERDLRILDGVGHNDVLGSPEAWAIIVAYLDARVLPRPTAAEGSSECGPRAVAVASTCRLADTSTSASASAPDGRAGVAPTRP